MMPLLSRLPRQKFFLHNDEVGKTAIGRRSITIRAKCYSWEITKISKIKFGSVSDEHEV